MKKNVYLQTPVVMQFIDWLSANLDNGTLAHSYTNRRTGNTWSCSSLHDSYVQYHWPHSELPRLSRPKGSTFAANAATLNALRQNLQQALYPPPNDAAACTAAMDVMTWGGVRAGNARWLNANEPGLANLLIDIRDALNANDTGHPRLRDSDLRFNAGMTKVYSLICDSLVIYDSRVAAALGWIVVKFCQAMELPQIPMELRFPWAPAKTAPGHPNPKQRNPSVAALVFPALKAGPLHAEWSLKASWLLEAALTSPNAQTSQFKQVGSQTEQLRALEAALFMIGYDLAGGSTSSTAASPSPAVPNQPTTAVSPVTEEPGPVWYDCYTLGKRVSFHYRITANGIEIDNDKAFDIGDINAMLNSLWNHFGYNPFPLANSATKVRNGTAPMGMGTAYFQATDRNPPETSKLAAVLEELDIIIPFNPAPAKGMHWTLNTHLLGLNQPQDQVNISSILGEFLALADED